MDIHCCEVIRKYLPYLFSFALLQFQFVNSFLSLFYIAFYLQDQEKLKEVGKFKKSI